MVPSRVFMSRSGADVSKLKVKVVKNGVETSINAKIVYVDYPAFNEAESS